MSHIHTDIDFTVCAYIVHNDRILFIFHRELKRWLPIGGHIELTETPDEALFREIQEESGIQKEELTVLTSKPMLHSKGTEFLYTPNFVDIHDISKTHRHIGMVYVLCSSTDKLVLNTGEHQEIRWVSKAEIEAKFLPISPAIEFYALSALQLAQQK